MTPRQTALKAADKANKIILKHFRKTSHQSAPKNKIITTKANTESEKIILKVLEKEFPKHYFSTDPKENITKLNHKHVWAIDSLDGTGNFSRGLPIFGISICLLVNKIPRLGLISLPILNITITAEKDKGAFLNNKKITTSKVSSLNKSFIYLPTAWKEYQKIFPLMKKICPPTQMTRQVDSTSFGLAQIALGEAEALVHYESVPNDLLAGTLIAKEAGGRTTDFQGGEWNISSKNIIASSNSKIHKKILTLIKSNEILK